MANNVRIFDDSTSIDMLHSFASPVLRYVDQLSHVYRAHQLYKNISMLFLFPVKDGKLSTGVIAIFNASCYG